MSQWIKVWLPIAVACAVCEVASVGLATLVYEVINLPSVVKMSFFCPLAVLASGLAVAWMRWLPRFCGRSYSLNGKRFFLAGALAGAFVLSFWIALLDLSAGALTASFAANLRDVLPTFFAGLGVLVAGLSFLIFSVCVGWRRV